MLNVKRTTPYNVQEIFRKCEYTSDGYTLPYRIYIPKNYDCGERYPLLLFLHGAGERGCDNESQLNVGLCRLFDDVESPVYDAIVVAPQCPADTQWVLTPWENGNYTIENTPESRALECVCGILDECRDCYNIDDDRVYVTGLSMGGFGTWDLLARHGARFAAGVPICGGGDPARAKMLTRIPIWTFHGSEDPAVPVAGTRAMFAAIKREGGEQIGYTEFDGAGHGIWDAVYTDRSVIDWLFAQSREERRKKAELRSKITKTAAFAGGGALSLALIILNLSRKRKKNGK
ncbi:MAG: alpha/beta hydrolase-fold protein [Eubacteriales bacterium]